VANPSSSNGAPRGAGIAAVADRTPASAGASGDDPFAMLGLAPAYEVVGRQIHESARLLWPAEAGDPVESLGLGTWDFGEPLARHFRVVFDKPAP